MDVALAIFNVGAGLGVLAAGGALVYLAWQMTPLIKESRALTEPNIVPVSPASSPSPA